MVRQSLMMTKLDPLITEPALATVPSTVSRQKRDFPFPFNHPQTASMCKDALSKHYFSKN